MNKKNKVRTLYTFLFETEFTDQSTFTKKNSTVPGHAPKTKIRLKPSNIK